MHAILRLTSTAGWTKRLRVQPLVDPRRSHSRQKTVPIPRHLSVFAFAVPVLLLHGPLVSCVVAQTRDAEANSPLPREEFRRWAKNEAHAVALSDGATGTSDLDPPTAEEEQAAKKKSTRASWMKISR